FWDGQLAAQGSVVGRVEIGFGLRIEDQQPLTGTELGSAVDALLRQRVRVASGSGPAETPARPPQPGIALSNAGSRLASAYLRASTGPDANGEALPSWWLQAGTPFVIASYQRDREVESLPSRTVPVGLESERFAGLRVFLGRRTIDGRERPVWFFERDPARTDRDALRRLRINVTRLHTVIASLRILSDLQLKQRIAPTTQQAQENLKTCLSGFLPFLYRREYMGAEHSEFLRAALSLAENLTPGEFTTLRALHPAPGRGLRSQLDLASSAVATNLPAAPRPLKWDVFIAHAGGDVAAAEALYEHLVDKARVFLDVRSLLLGDDWDRKLSEAQRQAHITVVLVGATSDSAYYLRSEIATAITLARLDEQRYRVIPVYLTGTAGRGAAQPYGLNLKHGVDIDDTTDLAGAAVRILQTLEATRPKELVR
ncbi:MAG TPA: toll/interleukin-1 receptor domain-containing protein, partial [Burkholderiaceae bacterium]|nr:toll/interleukin-1 receptor domain-containing protein [Burkholderiaceae bacterium]